MKNFQGLVQGQSLRQLPLRDIIHFQKLLQANVQDLSTVVSQILSRNLFFDGVEDANKNTESLNNDLNPDFDQDIAELYNKSDEAAGYKMNGDGPASFDVPDDRKKYLSSSETIIEDLERQLGTFDFSAEQKEIGLFLIQSLDHHGFLTPYDNPIEFLVRNFEYREDQIKSTLAYLRTHVDPAGLFAEDNQHSLQIQTERLPNSVTKATLMKLINDRYDDLMSKNLDELKSYLRVDNFEIINDVYRALEALNPVPLPGQGVIPTLKTKKEPDFVVSEVNGLYAARATEKNFPEIKVNQGYTDTLASLHKEGRFHDPVYTFLRNERRELNKTITMLRERQVRLEKVVSYVLNAQSGYLQKGDEEQIRPLLEKDIAAKFNISPSTVSRIASEKFVQTEEGRVLNLSELFSLGIRTRSGMRAAMGEIKEKIRELIRTENHNKPKTSIEIEKDLKGQGFVISSNNVRKICEDMKIPDSRYRKIAYNKAGVEFSAIGDLMTRWNLKPVNAMSETNSAVQQLKLKMG